MPPRGRPTLAVIALAAASALFLAACSSTPPAPSEGPRPMIGGPLRYDVTSEDGGARLSVVADLPRGLPPDVAVGPRAARWVTSPEVETAAGWSKLPFDAGSWRLVGCESGCRVRYGFDVAGAAREMDDVAYASAYSGAFLSPPSTWLLRPAVTITGVPFQFHVTTTGDTRFLTGVFPVAGAAEQTYGADLSDLENAPYTAFGRFEHERLTAMKGTIEVAILNSPVAAGNAVVMRAISEGARAVSGYFGRFPLRHSAIFVLVEDGDAVGFATTMGNGGGAIVYRLGRDVPPPRLLGSWVMTHEMVHLGFPGLARRHRWLEEGIATYVEPIARAREALLPVEDVWRDMMQGMPNAQPQPGEGGLDDTPTWARTYWGGALFCLLADVRIRERTANTRSLDDALIAVLEQGGDGAARWDIERVISVGDAATGTKVLSELYAETAHHAVTVDLAALWARLGVGLRGRAVTFDDKAPLAAIRKAITSPPAPSPPAQVKPSQN